MPPTRSAAEPPRWSAVSIGLIAVFAAAQLFLGLSFIKSASPTYDEAVHLASGYSYLATGRYRLNIMDHPPLAEMWAALPLVPMKPRLFRSHPDWVRRRTYHYADLFLFRNRVGHERMMDAARTFNLVTLTALLLAPLVLWARRLGGPHAAVCAAAAAAFCPVSVSNLSLVTTDGLSAVLFFAVFWLLSAERRSWKRWAAAGAAAGLALASKFNMVLLGPLAAALLLLEHGLHPRPRPRPPWAGLGVFAACAFASLALVYRVGQFPLFWKGLTATMERLGQGRSGFLMGEYSLTGFWLYFPVALGVKTPIPILAASLGAVVPWLRRVPPFLGAVSLREREEGFQELRPLLWVVVPAAGYFAAALASKVQIGVRHLMPMLPFLMLLAGLGAARLWRGAWERKGLVAALGLWLAVSVLRVHPYQLAYFNELAGGPDNGYKWLIDSNLDWGQGLKSLARELRRMGDPPVYLSYFGCTDPAVYGIRYVPAAPYTHVERRDLSGLPDPAGEGRVLLAVSASNLQAAYFRNRDVFAWLKKREPLKKVGHTVFLYDLTGDPEARASLARLVAASGYPSRAMTLLLK